MTEVDLHDIRRARHAPGLLRAFNDIGVLAAADVHVALRIAALAPETDESVILAAALAVRAPRLGHVFVDLATIHETAAVESDEAVDLTTLPWPEVEGWRLTLEASPLVAVGEEAAESRPLRLVGSSLYLDRYWREERQVAADLHAFGGAVKVDETVAGRGPGAPVPPTIRPVARRRSSRVTHARGRRGRRRRHARSGAVRGRSRRAAARDRRARSGALRGRSRRAAARDRRAWSGALRRRS